VSLLFHISFIHRISLTSSFGISPRSFISFSLSHFATSIPRVLNSLSFSLSPCPHNTFCTVFPLLPSNTCSLSSFPLLNLAHFSFFCTLSPLPRYSEISTVVHLSYSLLYLGSLILSLLSCLSVSMSLSLSSTFIYLPFALSLSSFQFFTSIPVSLVVFLSFLLLRILFFFLQHSVSCTLPFPPFSAFTLSPFLLHSSSLCIITWRFSVHF
jgi:hypothetical protein